MKSAAGYTLMELLVVLLLVSLITLTLTGGMHFGVRVWETVASRGSTAHHLAMVQSVLRQTLNAAQNRGNKEFSDFDGTPDRLSFTAPAPRALKLSTPVRVEISVADSPAGTDMKVAFTNPSDGAVRGTMSASFKGRLRIAYLDARSAIPIWLARWQDRANLPNAVRIGADDESQDGDWPEFIAHLQIDERAHCNFDPVSLDCG